MEFSITMTARGMKRAGMSDLVIYARCLKDAEVVAEALANQWPNQEVKVWRREFDTGSGAVVWKFVSTEMSMKTSG